MDINFLDINIIDTKENTRDLSLENASINSVKLIYNGAEDKFENILTSELHFSFLVKENVDAKYFHLFTGSETRYKVELVDVSNSDYPNVLWTGFILPEQFNEPYKNGNFFVDFIATDRLALLKNRNYLGASKVSVLQVINTALVATGLKFPVYFSEAIQNAGFAIDYLDLEVNTVNYIEDTISLYDALQNALQSIGCTLFLWENKWYVIGLNKLKEKVLNFNIYTLNFLDTLEFSEVQNYSRPLLNPTFVASPTVSVLSPLQKVTANWDAKFTDSLIPEDVVTHLPVNINTDIDDRTAKYWTLTTDKSVLLQVWLLLLDPNFDYSTISFNQYYNGYKAVSNPTVEDSISGPFIVLNSINAGTMALADLPDNFITLSDAFYVNGAADLERFASLKLEFFIQKALSKTDAELKDYFAKEGSITVVADNGSGKARITANSHGLVTGEFISIENTTIYNGAFEVTVINSNTFDIDIDFDNTRTGDFKLLPFAKNFFFAVTRKDFKTQADADAEIVFSNFTTAGIPENKYGFAISYSKLNIKGVLELEKMLLEDDGWYNIRLYPHVTNDFLGDHLIFNTCNFTLKQEEKIAIEKIRDIDFTTSKDLDLYHSSSGLSLSTKSFTFSDAFTTAVASGAVIPGELVVTPIDYSSEVIYYAGNPFNIEIKVTLNSGDYAKLQGGYTLYVLKSGETELTEIFDTDYILTDNDGEYILLQRIYSVSTFDYIEATDVIYLKSTAFDSSLQYAEYWLDKWKRYDVDESVPMYEVLVKMYHDLLYEYNFMVSGSCLALVNPLELISFSFKGDRTFYPTKLELDLHENTTELTMIESKNQNVTDYE